MYQPRLTTAFFALASVVVASTPFRVEAVSVGVAKKCNAFLAKEFPPREVGNPAAGSIKGTAQTQRDYVNKCVHNGGSIDGAADKAVK